MSTRRKFITQASLLAASVAIAPNFACGAAHTGKRKAVGLQLYSLKDLIPKDVNGIISKVAQAGFTEVETYGYNLKDKFWGLNPKEFKNLLQANGLKAPSGHYDFDDFFNGKNADSLKASIEAAAIIGSDYVIVPFLQDAVRKTTDHYKRIANKMNEAGKLCKRSGLKLAYHNHDFEFWKMADTFGLDIMLTNTEKSIVDFEMDIYWVVRSGNDPIHLMKKYPNRFKMLHVKDMDKSNKDLNTEVGNGAIDFKPIFEYAKIAGIEHFFVEQETNYKPNELASVKASCEFIQQNL